MFVYDRDAAEEQLSQIAHYPVDLTMRTGSLFVRGPFGRAALQHAYHEANLPPEIRDIVRDLMQSWQPLIADPTTDLGQMLQAGWLNATPSITLNQPAQANATTPSQQQIVETLQTASRRGPFGRVFDLAQVLETAFFDHCDRNSQITNADIVMALHNFYLWLIQHLENSMGDTTGALRKAVVDTLIVRVRQETAHA